MDIAHVAAFNIALIAAFATPGPALLYWIRATLVGGRADGIATGCGLAAMAAGWTLAALLGLDGIIRLFPSAYVAMKLAGATYLLWIAVQTWRHAAAPVATSARPGARAFLGGVLVNLANPKSVLFAAAVLVVIFPAGLSAVEKALIVGNHLAVEIVAYTALSFALGRSVVADRWLRAKPALDRIAATVMGALGVRLLLER